MSDILIRGMEMPKGCLWRETRFYRMCPLFDEDHYCLQLGREVSMNINKRPSDCPLIELQEHGRLIDADKLEKKSYEIKSCVGRYSRVVHIEDVKNAETILPADKEGGAGNG